MIFYIEERSGDRVSGKTRYPDKIYGWEGDIVHNFGEIPEENYWVKLETCRYEGGKWIKKTTRLARGISPEMGGNTIFACQILAKLQQIGLGEMNLVHFYHST